MAYIITDSYIHEPLYVIVPVFNSPRFASRIKLYERFAKYVKDSGGVLVTVEAAFGERHHSLQEGESQHEVKIYGRAPTKATEFHKARSTNPHIYHRVRTDDEIWFKENLINIGISRLPENWKYVAWVDADVTFARPNWVGETIHQLQHYKVVQMFSEAQDVSPDFEPLRTAKGFVYCYLNGIPRNEPSIGGYYYGGQKGKPITWHSGYSWAARREAIDELGGLIDYALMGAADNHVAHALIGRVDESYHPGVHPAYKRRLEEYQHRAETYIRRNIGYVSGLLLHYWHGKKVDRKYWERWKVIVDNQFNPDTDIKYDWQGLHQLVDDGTSRGIKLRDEARAYLKSRNEDSIDL